MPGRDASGMPAPRAPLPTLALTLLVALAGCLTGTGETAPQEPAPDTGAPDAEAAAPEVTLAGCDQFHTFYTNPVQPFLGFIPEGFRIATNDPAGATFDLSVAFSVCNGGLTTGVGNATAEPVAEAWVVIPVIPPAEREVPDVVAHGVPIVGYVTDDALVAAYTAWGLGNVTVKSTLTATLGSSAPGARVEQVAIRAPTESYDLRATLRESSGPWQAGKLALFVPEGKTVRGHLLANVTEGQNVGLGAALLTYQGSGGAPPTSEGIAHRVAGVGVSYTFVPAPGETA